MKVVVHVDGGARGNPGPAAIGVVIVVVVRGTETMTGTAVVEPVTVTILVAELAWRLVCIDRAVAAVKAFSAESVTANFAVSALIAFAVSAPVIALAPVIGVPINVTPMARVPLPLLIALLKRPTVIAVLILHLNQGLRRRPR